MHSISTTPTHSLDRSLVCSQRVFHYFAAATSSSPPTVAVKSCIGSRILLPRLSCVLRISLRDYSHANDARQQRSFFVKCIGEGVDDNGGPYRAVVGAATGDEPAGPLEMLVPCPNAVSHKGANHDKMCFNADKASAQQLRRYHFWGRLAGEWPGTVVVIAALALDVWTRLAHSADDPSVHMHTHTRPHTHAHTHTHGHTHTRRHSHAHSLTHPRTLAHTHPRTQTHIATHTRTRACAHIATHIVHNPADCNRHLRLVNVRRGGRCSGG